MAYQERGVPEYWQIRLQRNTLPQVDFVELQTKNSPRLLPTSNVLPGLTVAAVQDCLQARRRARPRDYALAIRKTLSEHGIVHERPAKRRIEDVDSEFIGQVLGYAVAKELDRKRRLGFDAIIVENDVIMALHPDGSKTAIDPA